MMPHTGEMPADWPGKGLDEGLREEHLYPNCEYNLFLPLLLKIIKTYASLSGPYTGRER